MEELVAMPISHFIPKSTMAKKSLGGISRGKMASR
jgi:hypothetical protein